MLDVGYIERSTKEGVPKYDATDTFTFMFQGVVSDLVKIPDGTYRAKDEGLFLKFANNGVSGWEVRDKSGTRYLFGQTTVSQVESVGNIFRWALDKVVDVHGNTLTVTYAKDQGQLYPAQIDYTGHDPSSLAPANRIVFTLESRPDVETSYRSGFAVTTAKRLKTIEAKATVSGVVSLARRYTLAYTQSPRTGRSLLSAVTQVGTDGTTSLPATTFTYTQDSPSYLHCHNCVPGITQGNNGWQVQYHVGNLWAKDFFGNDQRLWPSGGWEPGVQQWSETTCKKRKCTTAVYTIPIPQVSWSHPFLERSGSSGGVSWSTDPNGNLSVSGPQDSHLLAMTWLYTATTKTISVSQSTSGRADVFYVQPGGSSWTAASGTSVPLNPGWTVVAITAYNETGAFSLSMSANLASQVEAMNHAQFSPMSVAGDFNGDGMTDLAHLEPAQNHWHVVLNSVSGFGQEQTWLSLTLPAETVPLVGDVDADGKADLILWNSSSGLWQVAKSTGSSFTLPATWHSGFGASQTPFMGDFNGDQSLDVGTFSGGTWTIARSTGSSFGSPTTWLSGFGSGATPLTGDFNGDGLTDVAAASGGTISVALSDGTRLVVQPSAWTTSFGSGQALTSADLNGDGLTDVVYYDKGTGAVVYAPSTGQGFGASQTLMSDHPFGLRGATDVFQVGDFRGNGLSGFGVFNPLNGAAEIVFAMGIPPDLLTSIANGLGGTGTITYKPSSEFDNTGGDGVVDLAFPLSVVTQVSTADGLGHTTMARYRYAGGLYDGPTKESRGFKTATVTDAIGTTTTTTFSQDLHTKGRPLSVEVRDSAGRLFTKTTNAFSCSDPYLGIHFTKLDQVETFVYDGDTTFRQVRSRFLYDQYGNLTTTSEDGLVRDVWVGENGTLIDQPTTGDERSTKTTYLYNETAWLLNKPSLIQTFDASGTTIVAQRRFYYDGATTHTTAPTVGNLTKEEEWRNLPTEQWLATTLTYDPYGNVKTVTDALGRTTTNTYDATGTYLTKITNALGHTRQLAYDARFGQVTSSTDQNAVTTTTEYDALGRVTKVIGPTDTAALPTISYGYDLSTNPAKTTVSTRLQSGQPAVLTAYTFIDGLGRTIQTRAPAEDPTKQVVTGAVEFDSRGLVSKQWVSYLDVLSTSYVSHTIVPGLAPPVSYTYDAVGRLIEITDPDGSKTRTDYNDGETTTILANGSQTNKLLDAYGRLSQVEEVVSATETHTTVYTYDALNNLTKVTDAKGHLTTISYDSLGRKLSMDDPDMGRWQYAYDAVDNLTSQTDARGVTISFTYDALNRLTQKSYTIPANSGIANPGTVTYTYDNPAKSYSKGKLTEIMDGSGSSSFEYDQLGRLVKESKTIDGTPSTIQRSYDLLGRITSLGYPDTEAATYTYNTQGGIETITLQQGATTQTVVSDVAYNAAGQLTKIIYGNGTISDYTYNPQTLRLDKLLTTGPSGTLQDFTYTFDPIGNVTQILDRVHTATQTFTYDKFNRLTQAIGSYGTSGYAYDPLGNMTSKEGVTMTYGLADGSKPHAVTSTSAGWTLTYDANGNLIKKVIDARPAIQEMTAQSLRYDAENRLVEVKTAQEVTVTLQFKPGHNFFSLPVIPDDLRISTLFPSFAQDLEWIGHFQADYNDPFVGDYRYYVGNPKSDDFTALEYGKGYQLYCKNPNGFTVQLTGRLPTSQYALNVLPEWHLLPAMVVDGSQPVSWLLQGVNYDQIKRWNPTTKQLENPTEIVPGESYFVHVVSTSLFKPPLPRDVTTKFVYDGDGGTVKRTTAAGTTTLLGEVFEKAPGGATTKYVFAGSLRIAAKDSTGALRFYHGDHLGSSNVVTDGNGTIVELNEHLPFGSFSRRETVPGSEPREVPGAVSHHFTGQRQDTTNGLILFPARAYDPALGRFLQPDPFVQDPADPQTLNRYSYVRNNPVKYIDPSGYGWIRWVARIVGAIIGALIGAAAGPEGAVTGAIIGFAIGDSIGAAIEGRRDSAPPPSAPPAPPAPHIFTSPPPPLSPAVGPGSAPVGTPPLAAGIAAASTVGSAVSDALADAWEEAKAVAIDMGVSAGRAADAVADALASPQAATLGRSTAGTAMSRTIDLLSQYGRPLTGPELAGAAPGGLGLDVGLLKTRALRGFKGAGRPLAVFLTVNEVVNTYQNPLLGLEEQNQRAGIQVTALVGKLGGVGLIAGLVSLTGVGAPVAFGIQVVGGGLWSGVVDAGKDWWLRRKGLSF